MNKRNKAFTLIELQITSIIALIVLIAAFSLYISSWRSFNIGDTLLDVYANSRNAYGWLTKDIRCATQVVAQYPETGSPVYQTSDNAIVLKVPSIDASYNVIGSQYDYIIYRLLGSDLYRIVIPYSTGTTPSSRLPVNSAIGHYCSSLTFSSGGQTLSYIVNHGNLSTVNTVAIYLPINKTTISLSGAGTVNESINPTTVIRLRNK